MPREPFIGSFSTKYIGHPRDDIQIVSIDPQFHWPASRLSLRCEATFVGNIVWEARFQPWDPYIPVLAQPPYALTTHGSMFEDPIPAQNAPVLFSMDGQYTLIPAVGTTTVISKSFRSLSISFASSTQLYRQTMIPTLSLCASVASGFCLIYKHQQRQNGLDVMRITFVDHHVFHVPCKYESTDAASLDQPCLSTIPFLTLGPTLSQYLAQLFLPLSFLGLIFVYVGLSV
jgi:hypothetical protein